MVFEYSTVKKGVGWLGDSSQDSFFSQTFRTGTLHGLPSISIMPGTLFDEEASSSTYRPSSGRGRTEPLARARQEFRVACITRWSGVFRDVSGEGFILGAQGALRVARRQAFGSSSNHLDAAGAGRGWPDASSNLAPFSNA
jgi:hypothetical protein